MTSVIDAVKNNNSRILLLLVATPGSVKQKDLDRGLLYAVKDGYLECVKCLIAAQADINTRDGSGSTTLHLACSNNRPHVVKALLEANCCINALGNDKNTALHVAARRGYSDCAKLLMSAGAEVDVGGSGGCTPLIFAVSNKQYDIIKALLSAGCDVDARNDDGKTALHYAAQKAAAVQLLLSSGANPNVRDNDGNTPLMLAAFEGFSKVVSLLARAKCDVNMRDTFSQKTALHTVAYKGHVDCLEDLMSAGADINLCDSDRRTPLWFALKNRRCDVAKVLLKANSHVDTFRCPNDAPGDACPARLALRNGLTQTVKQFIVTGYDKEHLRSCLLDHHLAGDFINDGDISVWLEHAHQPLTMKQACRKWIRHYLGRFFYHDLAILPIPEAMKQFLLLKELDEV